MSSTAVAEVATSSSIDRKPTPVTERKMLWNQGSVSIKIPLEAKWASYKDEKTDIEFLQFARFVKSGAINLFLHNASDDVLGRTITADVELWQKVLADGRSYLYVDLRQSKACTEATHRMVIAPGEGPVGCCFKTPKPMNGFVLFTEPDSKYLQGSGSVTSSVTKLVSAPVKPANSTGDAQLDRYLADGWKIDVTRTNDTTVFLYKGEGSGNRHMTHHRPKKKK